MDRQRWDNIKFTEWRKKVNSSLPALAIRIFDLRLRGYIGCGFHWYMEKELGKVIFKINDYDDGDYYHGERRIEKQVLLRVLVEELYRSVDRAEQSRI